MPIEMKMPRLSDTMEVGTVVKWNVKPGQAVKSGDVIADIETDKATMELQTFDEGTVASLAIPEGKSVPVGTTILVLAEAGENVDTASKPTPAAKSSPSPDRTSSPAPDAVARPAPPPQPAKAAAAQPRDADRVFASPLARKIAGERGVDLGGVRGTGPSGRIVRKDVESAPTTAAGSRSSAPTSPVRRETSKVSSLSAGTIPGVALPPADASLQARTIDLSNMRATIAKRLVQSKSTIPHYQVTVSARMDALLTLRSQLNDQLAPQGVKLSVNDFLVRACALAMHAHPFINSRWKDAADKSTSPSIELLPEVNIGVAIALPIDPKTLSGGGLVVATIRSADRLGLRQISQTSRALSEKARSKGLTIEEMGDSTFTISNLGMFGVDHFTAIINTPNAAILAVGAAIEKPVVNTDPKSGEKHLGIGHEMSMTMSIDHRVIDGAMAAQYLATVKDLLERPATLLV
ncbi:MAG: 2-oxo acid dehydrogenase subunit E2 [Phycisphaeraceae bacterium]|nr:2-oxo acid dehydrogenase subunit E2 [Phycisphaeraceae bacterium]